MLADPQSITISGTANSLPAINRGQNTSEYSKDDGTVKLTISHAYGKRTRRQVRVTQTKLAADPFKPSENVQLSASVYIVVDIPPAGFSNTEAKAIMDGLTTFLTASSGANATKFLGGES